MAWDFLNKLLGNEPEAKPVATPPEMEVPPTPFYASHVPKLDALAAAPGRSLYKVDQGTVNKQRYTRDPVEEAALKDKYKDIPMNVGVGPFPTRRSQNKGNKVYQTKPGTIRLAKGD
jgi:hypothetical protein